MKLEPSTIQLRFVSLDQMLLHEEDDPYRVQRLVVTLKREAKLRNPPIVAEAGGRYIVLDGATRTTALREMGYRDAVVQVVTYGSAAVQVGAWYHVIVGLPQNYLLSHLAAVDGVTPQAVDAETACNLLGTRSIIACIMMRNGQWYAMLCDGAEPGNSRRAELLCQFVSEYRGKAEVHRAIEIDMPALTYEYPDLAAVIAFPSFTPLEIADIAYNGSKLPMGITRHVVMGRALGLDIPLTMLTDAQTLEAKNTWLNAQIMGRLKANKIRLYQEPVFVFDE